VRLIEKCDHHAQNLQADLRATDRSYVSSKSSRASIANTRLNRHHEMRRRHHRTFYVSEFPTTVALSSTMLIEIRSARRQRSFSRLRAANAPPTPAPTSHSATAAGPRKDSDFSSVLIHARHRRARVSLSYIEHRAEISRLRKMQSSNWLRSKSMRSVRLPAVCDGCREMMPCGFSDSTFWLAS